MRFEVVDPSTGALVRTWPEHRADEVEARVRATGRAARDFASWTLEERSALLTTVGQALLARADELAELAALEMGKPVAQGVAEVKKCAWACDFFAQHAPAWLADEVVATEAQTSWIQNDPLGVVLAIMPWNFPYWQVFRFAAPALMAGNAVLLKHAPSTPGAAVEISRLFADSGAPPGLVTEVFVDQDGTGRLLAHPGVAAVTLTGSTRAGRAVASRAGGELKPSVLELGGSDPFVVLADADVERAAATASAARLQNAGQSCIAAKRFIVDTSVASRFIEALVANMGAVQPGPPREPATALGPLARRDLRAALDRQVGRSTLSGARLVLGGRVPLGPGFFYPPTVLTGCGPGQPAWDEETFGPVAAVRIVRDEAEALEAANEGPYGLGASVWTSDLDRARALIRGIRSGSVFVNDMVRSDPRLPFGGVGSSGFGRELGRDGTLAFVNRRGIWVGPGVSEPGRTT